MKVCYFVSEYPAVSHTFIRREIVELERSGIEILRVSLRRNAKTLVDPADFEERGLTKYLLDEGALQVVCAFAAALAKPARLLKAALSAAKLMKRSYRPPVFHLAYLAEALLLARWIASEDVRHIHAHFGTNGAEVAMLAHLLTGVPYSFTVHGPDEFDRPEFLGLAEKVRHAAFVCAVTSFTRAQICRWIPAAEWDKVKVIRCGLDGALTMDRLPTAISKRHFVSVGRLSEQKGFGVLLSALATLKRQGVLFTLTLAGDGPLRPELEQRIRTLGLEGQVELTGWLTNAEVRARILNARAVVLPSFAEGLPVVLMEALALGRPVITTFVAGIPELVTDEICGWLVPAGSAEELSRAMKECLNASDAQIQSMGQVGRARVLARHDIARECCKLADLFRGCEAPAPSVDDELGQATDDGMSRVCSSSIPKNPATPEPVALP